MDDVLWLSRLQFAFTVAFHYLYPPLSIGLGVILVLLEGLWLKTKNPLHRRLARFWTKVFALTFAIGVASGIVMEFEFGTNWAAYSRFVGDVFGSALAAEGIFAFFLESGFLALLLFGWDKVGPKTHFFSTCMVALGAHFSAVWIVVANSWQQTPAGFHIVGEGLSARAEITDFWAMVFNPSSVTRLAHTLGGCWLAGAALVMSVGAWYLLKKRHGDFAAVSLKTGLAVALAASLLQVGTGHHSAKVVAAHQPAKLAAFEGLYETRTNAPLYLAGRTDPASRTTTGIAVPGLLSRLVHGDAQAAVTGLDAFAPGDRPNAAVVFQTYHLMVAIGLLHLALLLAALVQLLRGRLAANRPLLWGLVLAVLLPQLANQLGWVSAEVGRQPWIVHNLLRTADGLSKVVSANAVLTSLILFTLLYALLFALFLYLLNEKIKSGPAEHVETPNHE
ncbi:MAG: cytochrome ubiquinol oxidase subunit I [Opitutaceae bacterium]|jgi:cytochrome d ubiquinol oxidase subunit I|nr:cytochrome ubiquinol oxidase subunit I [Opitutaceae bacterium]